MVIVQNEPGHLILVIDDDEPFRRAITNLLKSNGYEVEIFSSAEAFLDSAHTDKAGCLILDVQMPGMSGLELQRRLVEEDRRIPIIFITAHGTPENRDEAIRAGAVDFLPKPFSEQSLLNAIHKGLQA